MNTPAISVLMPAYNAGAYISEAIHSVLTQTFADFELLIVDDGSTDDTVEKIKAFDDKRIRLIRASHKGVAPALNLGLNECRGNFIARFDADDVCYADRLKTQFDFMNTNPDFVLIGSEAQYVDMHGEYVFTLRYRGYTDTEIRELDPIVCPFSHVTVMYRKDAVLKAGGYDCNAYTFEDHLLWRKMIGLGKVCNMPQPLVKVRFNPESVTIDEKWRGRSFVALKYACIREGSITAEKGEQLQQIIKQQDSTKHKLGAYYSLIAKKYLWDNHHPSKARKNLGKLINYYPAKPAPYLLYLLSFLPRPLIFFLYRSRPKR
jgi:glycosyltransferase involved in cell wall biosynthesis